MPFISGIGPVELIIILVIALIVVGPGRLPDVGSALGKSIREFRKAATDVKDATSLEPAKPEPSSPAAAPAVPARSSATPPPAPPPAPASTEPAALPPAPASEAPAPGDPATGPSADSAEIPDAVPVADEQPTRTA